MTTRELISELLDFPMDEEVELQIKEKHIDEYGNEVSGCIFHIDSVDKDYGYINFTDWRKK